MIGRLLTGAARALFQIGILLGFAAALAFYGSWRLLRAATVGAPTPPRQAALWQLFAAAVVVARTFQPPGLELAGGDDEPELDDDQADGDELELELDDREEVRIA